MPNRSVKQLFCDHLATHGDVLSAMMRIVSYSTALLSIMWVSEHHFGDTYTANWGLFVLFATVFELLWNSGHSGARYLWYLVVVVGLAFSGCLLLKEAIGVKALQARPPDRISQKSS